jgi:hypothetical protein
VEQGFAAFHVEHGVSIGMDEKVIMADRLPWRPQSDLTCGGLRG